MNEKNIDGFTCLHYAALKGDLRSFEFLVNNGADVMAVSNNGVNCLHLACQNDKIDMVMYLINRFAFDTQEPTFGSQKQPVHIAALSGSIEVLSYLVEMH